MRRRGNKTAPTATGAGVPGSAAGWTRAPLPGNYWPAALPGTPAPASVPMASRPALAVSGMAAAAPARPSARCTRSDAPLSSACAPKGAPASGGAGNLTNDGEGRVYAWDPENRLNQANVTSSASPTGFGLVASYQYDALGRRVAKTWGGQTTRYLCAGAQVVEERDSTPIPSQADITGTNKDGSLANASLTPATGGILPTSSNGPVKRVNFQPSNDAAPAGYLKDAGKIYAVRSNAQSYGWNSTLSSSWVARRNVMPVPEIDTLIHFQKSGSAKKWEYALPNGSYPVIVVAGDPTYRNQTNNLSIENVQVIDPDPSAPQGYEKGDFDGYAVQVTITDGRLTIQQGPGAVNAKICYVEIGAEGTTIDQATQDRLAALIESATTQTAATVQSTTAKRQYVFGTYVDELLSYTNNGTRYFTHSNHVYSPSAVTNAAGQVQERYRYDAYGKQTITTATGITRNQSAVGFSRGFTGYILDEETGLYYARARMYSAGLGRFIARDPTGYNDGYNFYCGYFVPLMLDPYGNATCNAKCNCKDVEYGESKTLTIRIDYTKSNAGSSKAVMAAWKTLVVAAGSSLGGLGKLASPLEKVSEWYVTGAREREFKVWECVFSDVAGCCIWTGWTQVDLEYAFEELARGDDLGLVYPDEGALPDAGRQLTENDLTWTKLKTISSTPPCPAP